MSGVYDEDAFFFPLTRKWTAAKRASPVRRNGGSCGSSCRKCAARTCWTWAAVTAGTAAMRRNKARAPCWESIAASGCLRRARRRQWRRANHLPRVRAGAVPLPRTGLRPYPLQPRSALRRGFRFAFRARLVLRYGQRAFLFSTSEHRCSPPVSGKNGCLTHRVKRSIGRGGRLFLSRRANDAFPWPHGEKAASYAHAAVDGPVIAGILPGSRPGSANRRKRCLRSPACATKCAGQ